MARWLADLRSDLMVPRPPGVGAAMAAALAEPGALRPLEDPHERRLIEALCDQLGFEAAVFVPTCTLANQIAVRCWLPRAEGEEDQSIIAGDARCHLFTTERRALDLIAVETAVLAGEQGHPTPAATAGFLDEAKGRPAVVWLENTHNLAGGSLAPTGWQVEIARLCAEAGAALHLDGSRLWNAAAARGVEMSDLTAGASSVAVSLNKAVGAPMGAVLAGPRAMIDAAVGWRTAMSGDWRPIGPMAAGALAALPGWRERLNADHDRARRLADALAARLGAEAVQPPASNILMLTCPAANASRITAAAAEHGVGVLPIGRGVIRLTVHGGLADGDVEAVAEGVAAAWEAAGDGR